MKKTDNITNIIMLVLAFTIMYFMSSCSKPELPYDEDLIHYDSLRLKTPVVSSHVGLDWRTRF